MDAHDLTDAPLSQQREMRRARERFVQHKKHAVRRGIPFRMTFEEWQDIWQASGHWHERGRRRGQFQMARLGDKGGYEVGNVRIITIGENRAEYFAIAENRAKAGEHFRKLWRDTKFRVKRKAVMHGNQHFLGHKHSAASLAKMSEARRRRMSDPTQRELRRIQAAARARTADGRRFARVN